MGMQQDNSLKKNNPLSGLVWKGVIEYGPSGEGREGMHSIIH